MTYHTHKRGFTLIELLVVIAIIGILSAVVLASLNTARSKGSDSGVEQNLDTVISQAAIYQNDHSGNYGTADNVTGGGDCAALNTLFADDSTIVAALQAVQTASAGVAPVCSSNTDTYMVAGALSDGTWWCVDSAGTKKAEATAPANTDVACAP